MMTERPKRPLSAYMLWLNQARESIKLENPGIKVTEVAKRGGELWRAMSDKSEWEQKAVKAKSEYTRALEEFEANGGVTEPRTATKRGKKAPSKKVTKTKKKKEESEEEGSEIEESD